MYGGLALASGDAHTGPYEALVPSELLAVCAGHEARTLAVTHLLELLTGSPKRKLLEMQVGNHKVVDREALGLLCSALAVYQSCGKTTLGVSGVPKQAGNCDSK